MRQELEPLVVRLLRGQRRDGADDLVELEVGGFEVELAGLDLGEVEDVVDDRQQRRAGVVDLADVVALLGRELRLEGEVREADDGVHRRADLVAHVREEHGLHLRGFLGLLLGGDQFLAPVPRAGRACSCVWPSNSCVRRLRCRISRLIATTGSSSSSSDFSCELNGRKDATSRTPSSASLDTTGSAVAWSGAAWPRPEAMRR